MKPDHDPQPGELCNHFLFGVVEFVKPYCAQQAIVIVQRTGEEVRARFENLQPMQQPKPKTKLKPKERKV